MNDYRCDKCNKTFSGQDHAEQHFNSLDHQKRIHTSISQQRLKVNENVEEQSSSPPMEFVISEGHNLYFCTLCKCPCTGLEPMIQHIKSQKHKKNKECLAFLKRSESSSSSDSAYLSSVSQMSSVSSLKQVPQYADTYGQDTPSPAPRWNPSLLSSGEHDLSVFDVDLINNQYSCKYCKVSMSGEIPATQHLEGAKHKKKYKAHQLLQETEKDKSESNESQNEDSTDCHPSEKDKPVEQVSPLSSKININNPDNNISTPAAPYNIMRQTVIPEGSAGAVDLSCFERTSYEDKMRCRICDITVTGTEPALQHAQGKPHNKAVRAYQLLQGDASLISSKPRSDEMSGEVRGQAGFGSQHITTTAKDQLPQSQENKSLVKPSVTSTQGSMSSVGSLENRFEVNLNMREDTSNSKTVLKDKFWEGQALRSHESGSSFQDKSLQSNESTPRTWDNEDDTFRIDPGLFSHMQTKFGAKVERSVLHAIITEMTKYQHRNRNQQNKNNNSA